MQKQSFTTIRLAAIAGLACLTAGSVYAGSTDSKGSTGPFLNTDLGASFVQGLPSGVVPQPGIRFSFVPGYRLYSGDAVELSVQLDTGVIWNSYNIDRPLVQVNGNMYQFPILAGFEGAFHASKAVVLYLGVAGGGVDNDREISQWSLGGLYYVEASKNSFLGAVQGMAGVRYRLNEQADLGLGYKYLASFGPGPDTLGTHSVSLTFVWHF